MDSNRLQLADHTSGLVFLNHIEALRNQENAPSYPNGG
jgi:hypothetical protein